MYESHRTPAQESPILRYFEFEHLPEHLAPVSVKFSVVARWVDHTLPAGAEKATALRKLLEAKDAAVRAALDLPASDDQANDAEAPKDLSELVERDLIGHPLGHPCRDCGRTYVDHPPTGDAVCAGWR